MNKKSKGKIGLVEGNSYSYETLKKFSDKIYDTLLDGDNAYNGVKKDFEMYSPLIKDGGFIGFHDIKEFSDVEKFWNEIKNNYKHLEITNIGVIFK